MISGPGRFDVAVLIRCRDEVEWIGRVLDAVMRQTLKADVVVVDSGSIDGTLEAVAQRGQDVIHMRPDEFSYGRALNRGFAATAAAIVVPLSAHALPADDRWLERLVAPFADARVAATYGRQLPHPGLDPFRAREVSDYWTAEAAEDTLDAFKFSNANAAVRRTAWEAHPFDEALPYSEDREWAAATLRAGSRILYLPEAAVYHSHAESPRRWYRRRRQQAEAAAEPAPRMRSAVRQWARLVVADARMLRRPGPIARWLPLSVALRYAEVFGGRAGAIRARRGRSV